MILDSYWKQITFFSFTSLITISVKKRCVSLSAHIAVIPQ